VKKSFSELIRKQSISQENTRQSVILVNDFTYEENEKSNNENSIDINSGSNAIKVSLNDFNVKSVIGAGG